MADFRTDLVNALAMPLGRPRALALVAEAELYLRGQVQKGAEDALPVIRRKAIEQARPYLIGAGALVGGTLVVSVVALVRTFRKKKS